MILLLKRLFRLIPKEHWRLVKTLKIEVELNESSKTGIHYYHLFESDVGTRKVEFATTLSELGRYLSNDCKAKDIYHETVYPWLCGRANIDIPKYGDVPSDDTFLILKGKVNS